VEVEIRSEFADMAFALRGGGGLHFEEEVNLSKDDLLRICGYHTWLSRVHKREFVTVLFVKNRVPAGRIRIRTKQLHFTPVVVDCSAIDADTRLARLRQQVTEQAEVNELELLYLPLFHSETLTATELFQESARLIQALRAEDAVKHKLSALLIALAGKVVDAEALLEFWEEVRKMGNKIIEIAEAYGMQIGEERGIAIGEERGIAIGEERGITIGEEHGQLKMAETTARKMLTKGYSLEVIAELTDLAPEQLTALASL
jgi:hypothetical protein